jgi:hypothetical protein
MLKLRLKSLICLIEFFVIVISGFLTIIFTPKSIIINSYNDKEKNKQNFTKTPKAIINH